MRTLFFPSKMDVMVPRYENKSVLKESEYLTLSGDMFGHRTVLGRVEMIPTSVLEFAKKPSRTLGKCTKAMFCITVVFRQKEERKNLINTLDHFERPC